MFLLALFEVYDASKPKQGTPLEGSGIRHKSGQVPRDLQRAHSRPLGPTEGNC